MSKINDDVVRSVPEAIHGGSNETLLRRFGLRYEDVIDFSSSVNPYGPSPKVIEAVRSHEFSRYPDRESSALRKSISENLGVPQDALLAGSGSSELLHYLSLALIESQSTCLIAGPTYGEYERVARLRGAKVMEVRADEGSQFAFPVIEWERALRAEQPRLVFICRPNNPTGISVEFDRLLSWIREFRNTCFVIDEAYLPFVGHERSFAPEVLRWNNLVVLHSLTKLHALAGVRLGYTVAHPSLIGRIQRFRIPWNVSSVAQFAGTTALNDRSFVEECLSKIAENQKCLLHELRALGFECQSRLTAFLLVKVSNAHDFQADLLQDRLLVRDCGSFGLPDWIRVSTQLPEDHARLLDRLSRGPDACPPFESFDSRS